MFGCYSIYIDRIIQKKKKKKCTTPQLIFLFLFFYTITNVYFMYQKLYGTYNHIKTQINILWQIA